MLSILLSLSLGTKPGSVEAHAAVREYLQSKLDEENDPGRVYVSQWLTRKVLLELVDKKLSKRYAAWFAASEPSDFD